MRVASRKKVTDEERYGKRKWSLKQAEHCFAAEGVERDSSPRLPA
jgi:hypothetical protein